MPVPNQAVFVMFLRCYQPVIKYRLKRRPLQSHQFQKQSAEESTQENFPNLNPVEVGEGAGLEER